MTNYEEKWCDLATTVGDIAVALGLHVTADADAVLTAAIDAKAEVERLREQLRDTLEERATMAHEINVFTSRTGSTATSALDELRCGTAARNEANKLRAEVLVLLGERRELRAEADQLRRLAWEWCIDCKVCADYGYASLAEILSLRAEVDELSALAWEWCIEARRQRESVLRLRQRLGHDGAFSPAYCEAMADESADDAHVMRKRSTFDDMAEKAGPLPTAVLAQTEPPIESLGPVPVSSNDVEAWETNNGHEIHPDDRLACIERALAYTIRDAVRRGAKLEGE